MQKYWNIISSMTGGLIVILTLLGLASLVIGLSIYLIIQTSILSAALLLLLIPVAVIISHKLRKRRRLQLITKIRNDWGREKLIKERKFELIRNLFDLLRSKEGKSIWIDDQTWKDLNMDQLYMKVDRTLTDPGESVLYKMLREPLFENKELALRSRSIRFFQDNQDLREKIQLILMHLGYQFASHDLCNLLWRTESPRSRLKPLFTIMAASALVSLFIPLIFWSGILILIPASIFIINIIIHYSIKHRKDVETISLPYLISCIKTARTLSMINHPALERYAAKLKVQYSASRKILSKARFLFSSNRGSADPIDATTGIILEYINIFFLLEVRSFYAVAAEISKNDLILQDMYQTLGEIDALQSIASYRTSLASYAEPEFLENGIHLELKDAKQPLLDHAVPASVNFDKNVAIITGSNMGGKSTFLRNIGNNVIMAQTIATTCTTFYRGTFFRIITSISRTDDLMVGKSFYYVEAERILRTIQSFSEKVPTLCLVDEMLSGTNSMERLQASEAIIHYFTRQNTLAVIATHDLELAEKLNGICDFYHFTDKVDETGLKFDYQLKQGIAQTRNAIALLKYLGYPREITENT